MSDLNGRRAVTESEMTDIKNENRVGLFNFDFTRIKILNKIFKSRSFQPALMLLNLTVFAILILAGIYGTPIGNRNAAIIMVWILWFSLLIALLVPLGGRAWCLMCPLPGPGEWLSRLSIIRKSRHQLNLGLKWPKKLDNIWMQNFGFLIIATLSPVILTRPAATSYMLLFFIFLGIILSVLFKKQGRIGRTFCKYVCPVGGFIGLYSLMGAVEVKSKDTEVCKKCRDKSCIKGNEKGWGCPWYEYPGNMDRNLYCGLCTECIKTCPNENVAFRTRPFGADLLKTKKVDEAFKSFIMLGSGLFFLTVFFGWWGSLKEIADPLRGVFLAGPIQWKDLIRYGGMLWGVSLGVIPLVYLACSWLSKLVSGNNEISPKKLFVDYAYALVPLGLMIWVGFVVGMLMINGSYVVSVISDPFGWGWNLFGTSDFKWRPFFPGAIPYIQLGCVLIGLMGSFSKGYKISLEIFRKKSIALKALMPMNAFFIIFGVVFMYFFVMV